MDTIEEMAEKYPKIYQAVFDKGRTEGLAAGTQQAGEKSREDGYEAGQIAGAEAERERIQAVEAQCIPGHEQLIETLKFDGKTTGEQAAVKVLQAEKGLRADLAQKLKDDAPGPVPHAPAPEGKAPKDPQAIWDHDEDLRAEFQNDFARYSAFLKAEAAGQIRLVSRQ